MAFDGPPTKRVYLGPPPPTQLPDTMVVFTELDLRREVNFLREEVKLLRAHAESVTETHNTFVSETVTTVGQVLTQQAGMAHRLDVVDSSLHTIDRTFLDANVHLIAHHKELSEKIAQAMTKATDLETHIPEALQELRERYIPKAIDQVTKQLEQELKDLRDVWLPKALGGGGGGLVDSQVLDSAVAAAMAENLKGVEGHSAARRADHRGVRRPARGDRGHREQHLRGLQEEVERRRGRAG